jgi:hypothetical protein
LVRVALVVESIVDGNDSLDLDALEVLLLVSGISMVLVVESIVDGNDSLDLDALEVLLLVSGISMVDAKDSLALRALELGFLLLANGMVALLLNCSVGAFQEK